MASLPTSATAHDPSRGHALPPHPRSAAAAVDAPLPARATPLADARYLRSPSARRLTTSVLAGIGTGAAILAVSGVILLRYLRQAGDGLPAGTLEMAVRYVLPHVALIGAVYLGLGVLLGALAWWSLRKGARSSMADGHTVVSGRSTIGRRLLAILGGWAVLAAGAMLFSPTSLAAMPVVRDWPAGWTVAACLLVALCCGAIARVRWPRYAGGLAFVAAPLLLPDPSVSMSVSMAAAPADAQPHVFLLGVDNLGRAGMERLAARVAADRPRDDGVRYLAEAVSSAPLTRFTWRGILLHRAPASLVWMDTLATTEQRIFRSAQSFVLPRTAAYAGYRTTFVTDEAATNTFLPGGAFNAVAQDAVGWQVGVRRVLAVTFPVAEAYVGRWRGVGVTNAPGAAGTWRVWRGVAGAVAAAPDRPHLVAAHAVALHGVIRPSSAEVGGFGEVLRRRPSDLRADDPLSLRPGGTKASGTSIPQARLYDARARDVVAQTADFIAALERAGHRRRSLVIVFTDHGEHFLADSTRNLPGLHGVMLEPTSVNVGVLVLLPTEDPAVRLAPGGPRTLNGTVPLEELAPLITEFMAAHARDTSTVRRHAVQMRSSAPPGGWLAALARGDDLPRRVVAARSGGRPTLGDDAVYGGRRTFTADAMRPAVQLWPDGRITVAPTGVSLLDDTSDSGWTDGRWLVAYAPLAAGGFVGQCFRDAVLLREWRTDAPPPLPVAAPATNASPDAVCH